MIRKRRNHWEPHRKESAGAILAMGALAVGGCAIAPPAGPEPYTAYTASPAYYAPYYPYYGSAFLGAGFVFHRSFHRHHFTHHHFTHSEFHHAHR